MPSSIKKNTSFIVQWNFFSILIRLGRKGSGGRAVRWRHIKSKRNDGKRVYRETARHYIPGSFINFAIFIKSIGDINCIDIFSTSYWSLHTYNWVKHALSLSSGNSLPPKIVINHQLIWNYIRALSNDITLTEVRLWRLWEDERKRSRKLDYGVRYLTILCCLQQNIRLCHQNGSDISFRALINFSVDLNNGQ